MANMTFTVRIPQELHDVLESVARILGMSAAELSRRLLGEGIRRRLDPVEINRGIDVERARLLAAAERLQEASTDG